jgi:hypothetical protein
VVAASRIWRIIIDEASSVKALSIVTLVFGEAHICLPHFFV